MALSLPKLMALAFALSFALTACGDGKASLPSERTPDSDSFRSLCALPDDAPLSAVGEVGVRTLDHAGGVSELNLDWTDDEIDVSLCPGTQTLNLAIENNSKHTVGKTVWYTILYYYGQEYVAGHSIEPRGMDVAVGEKVPVQFSLNLRPEFASANRRVRIALIVQTDNPNPNDPVAFFRRVWINISPAQDCGYKSMPQPLPQPLTIHSVTCAGHNVKLQTSPRLVQGSPTARIIEGGSYMSLYRDAYLEDDLWWADLRVNQNIPNGEQVVVGFGSGAEDMMYFRFSARSECGGNGVVSMGDVEIGESDEGPQPPVHGGGNDQNGEENIGGGVVDSDLGEEGVSGEIWFELTPCSVVLEGTTVPSTYRNVSGELRLRELENSQVRLVLDARGLPAEPMLPGNKKGIYQPWLAKQEGNGKWLFVSLPQFAGEGRDETVNRIIETGSQAVIGVAGHAGVIMHETDGKFALDRVVEDPNDAAPPASFTHFFVTIEPAEEQGQDRDIPSPWFVLSGKADYPQQALD